MICRRHTLARPCLAALALLVLLAACTSRSTPMRGLLVYGHEARTFQPCGDNRTLWVHATGVLHQQLQTRYRNLAKTPYEAVYVEMVGETANRDVGEFARDYDATLEVHELRLIAREGVGTCRAERAAASAVSPVNSSGQTYVFVCDDQSSYTVRTTESGAWIFRSEGTLHLPAVPVGAGEKYANNEFEIRITDQQALLGEPGGAQHACRNDRRRAIWEHAKLDGADFRAVGNEPGWHLVIMAGSRIVLVSDYGASRIEVPLPEPAVDREARTTRWDSGELVLQVSGRPCQDSMSGEEFESTVIVTTGRETLHGCGRALH